MAPRGGLLWTGRRCGRLAGVAALSLLASCTALGAAGSGPAPHYATTVTSSGPINAAAIPLGDGYLSTTPKVGYVDSCTCLLYTSPSPRDRTRSRMPSSA